MVKPLATALKLLPPRPDGSIVLGDGEEDQYGEREVFLDLLAYGRVLGPRGEAEAATAETLSRWEHAWRGAPLIIHDAGLVEAIGDVAPDLADVAESMSTQAIGKLLEEHPGPVGSLRIECCPSTDVVGGWMDRLRNTKGEDGLRDLTVVNKNPSKNDGAVNRNPSKNDGAVNRNPSKDGLPCFPLCRVPCGLNKLSLCFFHVKPLDGSHLTGLAELRLIGCRFCGQELSAVTSELYLLRTLVFGYCQLTIGCGSDGLKIVSTGLQRLDMWGCTASGGVLLEYTPRLQMFCSGVRPQDPDGRLQIELRTPGSLREFTSLMMHFHSLSYVTHINAKCKGTRIAPLLNLSVLRVCIQMCKPQQILELLELLDHVPCLTHLTLMRVDNIHEDEKVTRREAFTALCIASSLKELFLDHFRGGPAELNFAIQVLAVAAKLSTLYLGPHVTLPKTQAADACTALMDYPHASADCKIQIVD